MPSAAAALIIVRIITAQYEFTCIFVYLTVSAFVAYIGNRKQTWNVCVVKKGIITQSVRFTSIYFSVFFVITDATPLYLCQSPI